MLPSARAAESKSQVGSASGRVGRPPQSATAKDLSGKLITDNLEHDSKRALETKRGEIASPHSLQSSEAGKLEVSAVPAIRPHMGYTSAVASLKPPAPRVR